MKQLLYLLSFLLVTPLAFAQKKNEVYQYHINRASSPIVLDGALDEPAWQTAQVAQAFWMVLPMDTSRARLPTDVRMAYDARNIYLSAVCYYVNLQDQLVRVFW